MGLKKEKERKIDRNTKAEIQERELNTRSPANGVRERGS